MKKNKPESEQEVVENKTKKEKKPLSKKAKIWIACVTAGAFVFASVATLLGVLLSKKRMNWHGLTIANYQNYTGIGAASFGGGSGSKAVAYAGNESDSGKDKMKLAGITKDNTCEQVEFVNDKGKTYKQKARLIYFDSYDKFTLFALTTNSKYEYFENPSSIENSICISSVELSIKKTESSGAYDWISYKHKDTSMFILDNDNGKIYDMYEIWKTLKKMYTQKDIGFMNFGIVSLGTAQVDCFGTKNLLWYVEPYGPDEIEIVQMTLTDNGVELSKRISNEQIRNWLPESYRYHGYFYQDIYGNIFSGYSYQKNDGTFVTLAHDHGEKYTFGFNKVCYKTQGDKTYYLNESGEFVEIECNQPLISISGTDFYYQKGNVLICGDKDKVYKVTIDKNDVFGYTVEEFSFERQGTTVAQGNFVYSLNSETKSFTKFDLTTGTQIPIDSKYSFKNLNYTKNSNRVTFKAVDNTTMSEVDGYFADDGEIFIGEFKGIDYGKAKVYIIKPIN